MLRSFFSATKILFICTLSILGCDGAGRQQIDREAIKQEMAKREIRHILPAQIVEAAYSKGKALSSQTEAMAVQHFQSAQAPAFITDASLISIDSLAKAQNTSIRWIPAQTSDVQLSELEQQLWDAYWYNVENELPVNDNVQKIDEETYLYTKPLMLNTALKEKLSLRADTTFPSRFLGMWSIQLSKKEIIQAMEE